MTMVLAGSIGYILGSIGGWAIGRYGGRPLAESHGRLLHLGPERLGRAERWFDKHDDSAVLIGRVVPVVRSFISIPAGIFRMPLGKYTVLTIPGSVAWCFVFAGIGWAFGSNYERFHHAFDIALVAGAVLLMLYLVLRRSSSRLKPRG
jgi:membrane protein DedA with SNARE-associated domain